MSEITPYTPPNADSVAIFDAIERAGLASTTKAQYAKAIKNYLATGASLLDASALAAYAQNQKQSTRAFLKSAVRLVTSQAAGVLKSSATPENVSAVTAGLYRLEALQDAISVQATKGSRAHTWLSQAQVKAMMRTCGDDLTGRRDWIVLALLVGAGLRREELVNLRFEDITEQYLPNGKARMVLSVRGKGAKDRVVPISDNLAEGLAAWKETVGGGLVARSLGMSKILGESLSAIGVFDIVQKHGEAIGRSELAPHDLRRTFAQLAYQAGVPITQISTLLGHANVATTQRYLDLQIDLEQTASDYIPLN
jgi:site-specific recombinase XerD